MGVGRNRKWYQIRHELYLQLKEQVRKRLGGEPTELKNYRAPFREEAQSSWRLSEQLELSHAIQKTQVVLVGDFHALAQSQRAFLRILRKFRPEADGRTILLGLECLFIEHKEHWKRYLSGKISSEEIQKLVEWEKNWHFPWENYEPIFEWAMEHGIEVLALNTLKTSNLKRRDEFAAKALTKALEGQSQRTIIFVLYGELHLAHVHLPQQIKTASQSLISVLRIFQNIDEIYFRMMRRGREVLDTGLVRKDAKTFCLLGVPPWVKWQTYLMFLEELFDSTLYEKETDYTDHVVRYIELISRELEQKTSPHKCSIYSAQDENFYENFSKKMNLTDRRMLIRMVEEEYSFYIPKFHAGYLGRITVNHAAGLAMQYFYYELSGTQKVPWEMPRDFIRLIWLEALTYFGSKLVNPRRKTESIQDLKMSLTSPKREDFGEEALKLALSQRTRELMSVGARSPRALNFQPRNKWSHFLAAHMLGSMMGERLFNGYHQRLIASDSFMRILRKPLDHEEFHSFYFEMVELIESFPMTFQSKEDPL